MPLKQPEKSPLPPVFLGLSDFSKAPHEVPLSGCCRKWVKETDSAYVRLAKQGRQRDLLKHCIPVVMKSPPAPYAAPDWYLHHTNPPAMNEPRSHVSSLPEYMIHSEFKADDHCGKSYEARRGPFDFDTKSVWQQDAEDKENAEKKKDFSLPSFSSCSEGSLRLGCFHTLHTEKWTKMRGCNVPAQRESEAVNFSKLISNGYGTDWIQQCTGWEKKIQETSENNLKPSQSEAPPARKELKPPFQGCNK